MVHLNDGGEEFIQLLTNAKASTLSSLTFSSIFISPVKLLPPEVVYKKEDSLTCNQCEWDIYIYRRKMHNAVISMIRGSLIFVACIQYVIAAIFLA